MATQTAAYRQRVMRALTHIEAHLDEALVLGALARQSGLSDWHFHRVFRDHVGEPPHAYAQRLRLERAAFRLKRTQQRVVEVAFEAGYQTHEAFTRAFKAMFGQAPLRFREDRWTLDTLACSPRVVALPARRVAFVRHFGPYERAPAAFQPLHAWAARIGKPGPVVLWGVPWDHRAITAPERLRFDAATPIAPGTQGDGEVGTRTLPAGHHVHVAHRGAHEARNAIYEFLYGTWMADHGYRPANSPPFEVYNQTSLAGAGPQTDIYVPVIRTRPVR